MITSAAPTAPAVTWSRVEDGFYVGSDAGAFVGHIEHDPSGSFLATNGRGQRVGAFATLVAARDHLTTLAA